LEFDDDGLVIAVLHNLYEFLEMVYIVLSQILALVPGHALKLSDGCKLLVLQAEVFDKVFFEGVSVQVVGFPFSP